MLCFCVVSTLYCIAQPANDNCAGSVTLVNLDDGCVTGVDITGATEDIGPSACTAGSNGNVWFNFTAQGVSAEITVVGSIGTPEITIVEFVPTNCVPANAFEVACVSGTSLVVDNELVVGNDYYIMVASGTNTPGTFDICIDNPEPAPNDACVDATQVFSLDGTCNNYNNDFPATDVLTPSCFTGSTYNVWFSFVAVGVSLDVNIPAGGPGVAQLAVIDFTGAVCNSTGAVELGCATGTNHIVLDNDLTIGETYYVVVGFQNSNINGTGIGDFELCIDNPIPAPNDECSNSIVIPPNVLDDPTTCYTSIAGNPLNNDWPSTDIGLFPCWNAGDSYNIWYSFVAQGPDVEITVDPAFPNADPQIALVEFTGTPCEFAGAVSLSCANATVLDYNDQLVIGNTYYIAVGFENNAVGDFCMNVFNPEPPPNDEPCNAIPLDTDNACEDGTTVYANPENWGVPPACESAISNTVWYTMQLSDPDNVGFRLDLDFDNTPPGMTVSIILWEITDCNVPGPIAFFYCDVPPTAPLEWGPIDENTNYYLSIGTSEPFESDFTLCVQEIAPCFTNDICPEATLIPNVISDQAFVCVDGCNLFADPETFNNGCAIGQFSTVWFQVPTDGSATLMNIQVTSDDFDAPTISLFQQVTDCTDLQPIGLTQSNLACIVGSNGEAEALATDVGSSEIYYIAVSSLNSVGGNFEICVNTISVASACVIDRNIEITARSFGGPLEGPFLPGEVISVCMNVNSYTAIGNGCQWFQGLVPVFGNGWDPASFDAGGQPLNATVNGNPIGQAGNGLYGASTWDWFDDVGYHHTNIFYQVGDIDGNGTVDMCNILYDPDCPDYGGITGGCCGPCWDDPGTTLPPGWFAYGINGTCGTPGPPIGVDWGDGNTCGCCMGPWEFCFDLTVRDYPECLEDASTMDLSLGFFTFADGEVGSWTGGASVCALDQPAKITLPMCCTELEEDQEILDPICSGDVMVYVVDRPGVDYWEWTVEPTLVGGATPGEGPPGTIVINTLTNDTEDPEVVIYTFLGFAGGACPVFELTVEIEVFPDISLVLDPLVLCATPTQPYVFGPEVTGGTGNYMYQWSPGGETTPTITVANPTNGTTYVVTVTDDIGCSSTTSMMITVYSTFPVDIDAPVTEQCFVDGEVDLSASASGGIDPYSFVWTFPGGSMVDGDQISSDESGKHLVVVTDNEGCEGRDSVVLTLNESPEVSIDALNDILALCEGESTQLTGVASQGETPYTYYWDTPDGPEEGKTIEIFTPGTYTVTVEDNNGCTAVADIEVEEQETPVPDIGPDQTVCNVDAGIELTVTDDFEDYQWSIGPLYDGMQSVEVYEPGVYSVTVTNEFGCTGETQMEILLYDQPVFEMPDTFEMCAGSVLTIDADDYGGVWDNYIWYQCGSCLNEIDITGAGEFEVTVFDENFCSATQEFIVLETAMLSPNLQGPGVICTGSSITLSADPGFTSYQWSANAGGATGNTANVSAPGIYSVTVGDAIGCSGVDTLTVISGDFTPAITGPNSICAGVQATLNAGAGYTNYQWSHGPTTQTVQVEEGSYTVTVTSTDGCTGTASITIIETPFVPVITGDTTICQTSESTVLDAGGPYTNYQWSANAGNAVTQTITTSTAGVYSVTITDLSGCVGTASFTVDNHPVPFVAIAGNPDFCVGGNTQMSATAGFPTYAWSTSEITETITINTPGSYTVTITDANGCTNTASTTVNPPYQETVTIIGSFVFCPGDAAVLEVPSGYASVNWSTGETSDSINVTTEGPVSVIVVDPDGCIAYDTVVTDENATLSPVISGDTAICDAGTAVLNAGPGFDLYQWSGGLGNTQIVSVNTPGVYTVTVSSLSGCMGTDDFEVSGYTTPFAVVAATATACNVQEPGGPSTFVNFDALVTGGDQSGIWAQVSGPGSVNIANTANVNFAGQTPGTYSFTYTTNSATVPCSEATYNMTVTVNDCACPSVAIGIAPDLCNDLGTLSLSTLMLPQTEPGGTWTIISSPPGSNPAIITGGNIFDASTADAGTYTLQYAVAGLPAYCPSTSTVTVNVLRTPVAGTAASPLAFCAGETQTVNLASLLIGADAGGIWVESSSVPSTGGAFNAATGRFTTNTQLPGTYTFDYIIPGAGPCPDDQVTVQVVIENNPVADAGAAATLDCNATSAILGGSGSSVGPEFQYSWTTVDGIVMNEDQLNATATAGGTYVLTVLNTVTGCSATDQVTIDQIGDFPTDIDMLVQSPDCEGDPPGSVQINAVVGGTAPYLFSLDGGPQVAANNFPNLQPGDHTLTVEDASGCTLTESFTIEDLVIVDLSIINYVNDTLIYAFGDTIKLSFQYTGTANTPDSVIWKMGDSILCINCPVLEIVADLAGKITLEAYDVRGCEIEKSISFLVVRDRDIYIPNIFSPNGDNLNDYFTLFTDSDLKTISLMEIYTRWGDLVFRKSNFDPNIPQEGWDGTFNGEDLNPGVYVYRIEIIYGDDLKESVAGDITIVR